MENPYLSGRNEVKVGKLIRKILQGIRDSTDDNISDELRFLASDIKDSDIEKFVNEYKSQFDKIQGKMDNFKLV